MGNASSPITGTNKSGVYNESSTQEYELGEVLKFEGGRTFRYCKNAAVALAAGKVIQSAAPVANHTDQTVAATIAANVSKTVTVDIGATAITAGQYVDGYLVVNDATGQGVTLKIKSHPASDGSEEVIFTLYDKCPVALTVDVSEVTLVPNLYSGVIVAPTTITATIVGVPLIAVTASYYFWAQTKGVAAVLINGTPGAGTTVTASGTTAGAVDVLATGTVSTAIVGKMYGAGVSTEYRPVKLELEG